VFACLRLQWRVCKQTGNVRFEGPERQTNLLMSHFLVIGVKIGTYFTQGGGGLIPKESQLKGEERKRGRKRRREGLFTIHLCSLFSEQFVFQNLKNLLMALNMMHDLFAYSLYVFELLENTF
jgi:hypothetical protein